MGADSHPEERHDTLLGEIFSQEGNNLSSFFNAIFGFLSRRCPEEIYGSTQISGEHLVSQSFCRWRRRYQEERAAHRGPQAPLSEEGEVPEPVVEEVVTTHTDAEGGQMEATGKAGRTSSDAPNQPPFVSAGSCRSGNKGSYFDTTNGAVLDSHSWTQSLEDLEVRVTVRPSTLAVEAQFPGAAWHSLLRGTFPYPVKAEESLWSLAPGEHVSVNLEKVEERWWDRLLTSDTPIDLKKINAERDYSTLPEEERHKIQELIWNKQQQEQGKPTSDQLKMESVLREAWSAEGSPFLGRPYDASLLNFADTGFGNG